ncbi:MULTISPECIES: LacI family DNA-binding transcriptional regulator [unclassified Actinomyces]|uniref:LacI family DNA-binding transcriptional regulator n=1 Tax=unclassified Actinomyces TaxID=2609248 RepID=UPI000D59E680|nr:MULTISPECIES: LacI family DNA-binding transcriptional regulator [unclassified Actinomyces]RAX23032.1 LacI family transcriptional regulator [Actinomyces sp. Z3]
MNAAPTISDLARALNLSISSVSYALNGHKGVSEATRRRVIEYATRVGYRANSSARALSRARTGSIGIVVRDDYAVIGTEPYYLRFLAGIAAALEGTEVELIVKLTESGLDDALAIYRRWAAERRVDGIILIDENIDDPRAGLAQSLGLPAVLHGTTPPTHPELPGILTDDAFDSATIVEHLALRGARRILHAAGPMRHRHEVRRCEAVAAECAAHGLSYDSICGSYELSHGERAADLVAARSTERPDAIVAANDLIAVAACRRLVQHDIRVPEDCLVVAWDNSVLCEITEPPISALDRHPERCGTKAAQMLLELLRNAEAPVRIEIADPSALVVRRSSAPLGVH